MDHRMFRDTSGTSKLSIGTLYFRRGSELGVARCARVTVLATRVTVLETMRRTKVESRMGTKLDLKRCKTLITSNIVGRRSTFAMIQGEKVFVRRTCPANNTVSTILKASTRLVRGVYGRARKVMSVTGCGYPKRVIVANRRATITTTKRTLGTTNTEHIVPLGIDNPFRYRLLGNTKRGLKRRLRGMRVRSFAMPCIAGMATRCIAKPRRMGRLLIDRISSSIH